MTCLARIAAQPRRLPLAIALGLIALPAFAQSTSQGLQSQATPQIPADQQAAPLPQPQNTPAPPPVTAPQSSFVLRRVVFTGASVFPAAQLDALAAEHIGKPVTLDDLNKLAQQVTALYHKAGYIFATAVVPVQEVKDGAVEISVIEGRLGQMKVEVDPAAPITEARIRAMLAPLMPGQPLSGKVYERTMLLLSDLPGIKAQSSLSSGAEAGTTDLVVKVGRAAPITASLGVDNFGTRESGILRAGGSLRWNSPFGIGDNLDARGLVSERGGTTFGRLSYEAPLGYNGVRAGAGIARVHYSLGGAFEPLDALGTSRIADASLTFPVLRQRDQNLFLRLSVDRKLLTDELRAVDYTSHKRVQGVGIGWAWERRDNFGGGGYFSSNGVLYQGDLHIRDPNARAYDQSIYGNHTEGGFTKLTFQFSRLQALAPKQTLFLGIGGQLSNGNLDASEKLSLGGHDAVRAYPQGEVLVDRGFIAHFEYRYSLSQDVTPYAFYDASRGWVNRSHESPGGRVIRNLRGPGLGVNWARPGNFSLDLTVAWRTSRPAVTSDGDKRPRVFFQIQKFF
ncbi:ShlB/FhaC/HecB family hemolysin secretion/activation protein [Rhodanobacter sp. OK091]|uniref:ShlB/FhaC/HecB family hemolysin secretion/activation protein n=1 Tax=Rhodanobacter sp. OK091 TaxID=1881037 RepID=UPI0009124FA1|nr:ShlB/FhaC/HecB family hemolysin secretion/activation protein [Rhodanobacter sp. OK091]SHL73550.1 Hemolysin activation/secretion protein [Rhodanobacter sp. OK091]